MSRPTDTKSSSSKGYILGPVREEPKSTADLLDLLATLIDEPNVANAAVLMMSIPELPWCIPPHQFYIRSLGQSEEHIEKVFGLLINYKIITQPWYGIMNDYAQKAQLAGKLDSSSNKVSSEPGENKLLQQECSSSSDPLPKGDSNTSSIHQVDSILRNSIEKIFCEFLQNLSFPAMSLLHIQEIMKSIDLKIPIVYKNIIFGRLMDAGLMNEDEVLDIATNAIVISLVNQPVRTHKSIMYFLRISTLPSSVRDEVEGALMMCLKYGLIPKSTTDPVIEKVIIALTNVVQIRRKEKAIAIEKKITDTKSMSSESSSTVSSTSSLSTSKHPQDNNHNNIL